MSFKEKAGKGMTKKGTGIRLYRWEVCGGRGRYNQGHQLRKITKRAAMGKLVSGDIILEVWEGGYISQKKFSPLIGVNLTGKLSTSTG